MFLFGIISNINSQVKVGPIIGIGLSKINTIYKISDGGYVPGHKNFNYSLGVDISYHFNSNISFSSMSEYQNIRVNEVTFAGTIIVPWSLLRENIIFDFNLYKGLDIGLGGQINYLVKPEFLSNENCVFLGYSVSSSYTYKSLKVRLKYLKDFSAHQTSYSLYPESKNNCEISFSYKPWSI